MGVTACHYRYAGRHWTTSIHHRAHGKPVRIGLLRDLPIELMSSPDDDAAEGLDGEGNEAEQRVMERINRIHRFVRRMTGVLRARQMGERLEMVSDLRQLLAPGECCSARPGWKRRL